MRLLIWQAIRICSLFIISGYFLNSLASYFMTKFLSAFYDPKGVLRRVYLRRFFLPIFLQTCKKIGYSCKNALLFELWRFYNQLCTILVRTSGNRCGARLCGVLETASIDHAGRDFPKFALHSKSGSPHGLVGSNPTASATKETSFVYHDKRGFLMAFILCRNVLL